MSVDDHGQSRPTHSFVKIYWTMRRGSGTAIAILYDHPQGFDLWIAGDQRYDFERMQVHESTESADRDADATRDRLLALGWVIE